MSSSRGRSSASWKQTVSSWKQTVSSWKELSGGFNVLTARDLSTIWREWIQPDTPAFEVPERVKARRIPASYALWRHDAIHDDARRQWPASMTTRPST